MKLTVKEKGANYVVYNEGYVRIDDVRISFPHIAYPQENENDDGNTSLTYNLVGIMYKETHAAARKALVDINNQILRDNADKKTNKPPAVAADKRYLKDGDAKDEGDNRLYRDEYENAWTLTATNKKAPVARDERGSKMEDKEEIEAKFYSGCRVNILVRPWFFNGKARNSTKTYPMRLSCGLEAVQFRADDEPFGAGRPDDDDVWEVQDGARNAFDDVVDEDDEL